MHKVKQIVARFDNFQQRHAWLGFPLAVFKKYGDDEAGNQAALMTYYGFLSLFPLLLVLLTLLRLLARQNTALQEKVIGSALEYFPIVGSQLQSNVHSLSGSGIGLAVGIILTLIGARGAANGIQSAFNHIWQVERVHRPGFPWNMLRSLSLIVLGGGGLILATTLNGYITGFDRFGLLVKIPALGLALMMNFGLLLLGFRLGTAKQIKTKQLILGAIVATGFWQVLQTGGSYLLLRQLKNFDAVYGTFAVVLGLLFWIYLQAQLALYAMEISMVKACKLYPRGLTQPPLTKSDKQAYAGYSKAETRRHEQEVKVGFRRTKRK